MCNMEKHVSASTRDQSCFKYTHFTVFYSDCLHICLSWKTGSALWTNPGALCQKIDKWNWMKWMKELHELSASVGLWFELWLQHSTILHLFISIETEDTPLYVWTRLCVVAALYFQVKARKQLYTHFILISFYLQKSKTQTRCCR